MTRVNGLLVGLHLDTGATIGLSHEGVAALSGKIGERVAIVPAPETLPTGLVEVTIGAPTMIQNCAGIFTEVRLLDGEVIGWVRDINNLARGERYEAEWKRHGGWVSRWPTMDAAVRSIRELETMWVAAGGGK